MAAPEGGEPAADMPALEVAQASGVVSNQNRFHRRRMEDRHVISHQFGGSPDAALFAVFDGHGNSKVSTLCEEQFEGMFESALAAAGGNDGPAVAQAFAATMAAVDDAVVEANINNGGSTCVAAYLVKGDDGTRTLHVANVGDSRAVLVPADGAAVRLSVDHNVRNEEEVERVVGLGGFVKNGKVNMTIEVTRSLGDRFMKEFIINDPYTSETVLEGTETWLVLACDGVFDVLTDDDVADLVRECDDDAAAAAGAIVAAALENASEDNLTAIAIRL